MKSQAQPLTRRGAELIVDTLIAQGVTHVFAIPGAKIDAVFDVLKDRGPELVLCRHEQNAAFMAAAVGRLTGKPGVCLVTSGPGASNLATGLLTANTEGDPVVAIAGNVIRADRLKRTHQSLDNAALFKPVTKYSVEVQDVNNIPEALTNAFRAAQKGQAGAAFISFPQDVVTEHTTQTPVSAHPSPELGPAPDALISSAIAKIQNAHLPIAIVGMKASRPSAAHATRALLKTLGIPFVETYQGAGVLSRELESQYVGRIGLFRNQPGDFLIEHADVLLTIGFDPIEYDPKHWNLQPQQRQIIHVDDMQADIDHFYEPALELVGNISETVKHLAHDSVPLSLSKENIELVTELQELLSDIEKTPERESHRSHPLDVIHTLRRLIPDDTKVTCDIGSHAIWMSRHFRVYEPNSFLVSNGMQTLGVALPWAIAASIMNPDEKIISVSGDGGFLFSAMELETAVRKKTNLVHLVWNDSTYDMVAFQQEMKYDRTSCVEFGQIDLVKYAESFGATGLRVNSPEELSTVLQKGINIEGPVIIDIPIDYQDNPDLASQKWPEVFRKKHAMNVR
ncbi:acetolactate synthase [Bacillus safensis FO-36b]|uniref:acetolactate synthase AlsS n=1 Tax=Bacillus TaxID=1386 RepID=UPI00045D3558|nr:acetolactate synthase AlsS [Bacillus safensis]AWI38413.1 acetolactate synthase [Bacillus safensis FO-36b]KDE28362.1 acetolactate synthase [Bacillus safensis FO-36b]KKD41220.1 acetolactate synthase [Bacillus safensis]MCM3048414.1 acetolactate synthase AlsS [Bacillus safensis]MCM3450218.1 acetolactate synthase AlsS [Bacillus safensis]